MVGNISRAQQEASFTARKIIVAAENKAACITTQMVQEAGYEAEKIIRDARAEAAEIVDEARRKAEMLAAAAIVDARRAARNEAMRVKARRSN